MILTKFSLRLTSFRCHDEINEQFCYVFINRGSGKTYCSLIITTSKNDHSFSKRFEIVDWRTICLDSNGYTDKL